MSFSDRVVGTVSNNNRETCFVVEVINDEIIEQSEETFSLVLSVEVRVFNNIIITASNAYETKLISIKCYLIFVTNNLWHMHAWNVISYKYRTNLCFCEAISAGKVCIIMFDTLYDTVEPSCLSWSAVTLQYSR